MHRLKKRIICQTRSRTSCSESGREWRITTLRYHQQKKCSQESDEPWRAPVSHNPFIMRLHECRALLLLSVAHRNIIAFSLPSQSRRSIGIKPMRGAGQISGRVRTIGWKSVRKIRRPENKVASGIHRASWASPQKDSRHAASDKLRLTLATWTRREGDSSRTLLKAPARFSRAANQTSLGVLHPPTLGISSAIFSRLPRRGSPSASAPGWLHSDVTHSPMQTTSATARIGGKALEDESMLFVRDVRPCAKKAQTRISTHEGGRVTQPHFRSVFYADPGRGWWSHSEGAGPRRRPAETKNERKRHCVHRPALLRTIRSIPSWSPVNHW